MEKIIKNVSDTLTVELGEFKENTIINFQLNFKDDVVIDNVRVGCYCTQVSYSKNVVEGKLKVGSLPAYNKTNQDRTKTVVVYYNGESSEVKLKYKLTT